MNNSIGSVEQKQKIIKLTIFLFMGVSILAILSWNSTLIVLAMIFTFVAMMIYCISNLTKNIVLAIMFICIFTFLSSSVIGRFLYGQNDFMYGFTDTEFNTACSLIIISYYMIFCGYIIDKHYRIVCGSKRGLFFEDSSFSVECIQKISFIVFVVSSVMAMFFSIQKMIYALHMGYISLYTTYSGSSWLQRLSFVSSASFFIGLAAKPNKKMLKYYFILGFIDPVITFIQGVRSTLVTYVLFLVFYCFTYNNLINGNDAKDNRKTIRLIFLGVLSIIIIIPFLYSYGLSRIGENSNTNGINAIIAFFDGQGGSFRVLGAAVKYKGALPQKWYSFGSIIDRFSDVVYGTQNAQRAMMAHSFADTITYLEEKASYLMGYGMGSCYIAEIFYDFGVLGVIIVNLFLGIILKTLTDFENLSIFKRSVSFILFQNVMMMPRGTFLRPIDVLFSFSTIVVFFIVFGASRIRSRQRP